MKVSLTLREAEAVEAGLKVAKARVLEIKKFGTDAKLVVTRFEQQEMDLEKIKAELKTAFREQDDFGRKYKPNEGSPFLPDSHCTYVKAAVELSAREDERLAEENYGKMPEVLLEQLSKRIAEKRDMLSHQRFQNLEWQSLLAEWGFPVQGELITAFGYLDDGDDDA